MGGLKTPDWRVVTRSGDKQGLDQKNTWDRWESSHSSAAREEVSLDEGGRRALLHFVKSGCICRTGLCLRCHIFQRTLTWKHPEESDQSAEANRKHTKQGRIEESGYMPPRKGRNGKMDRTIFSIWVDLRWFFKMKENLGPRRFHMT